MKNIKHLSLTMDNGDKYILEIDFNLSWYRIKKGNLYRGLRKLGKIKDWEIL